MSQTALVLQFDNNAKHNPVSVRQFSSVPPLPLALLPTLLEKKNSLDLIYFKLYVFQQICDVCYLLADKDLIFKKYYCNYKFVTIT